MTDCDDTTAWNKTDGGAIGGTSMVVENGDEFNIEGTCTDGNDENTRFVYNFTDFDGDTYNNFLIRWKTGVGELGLGARAVAVFTVGHQDLLGTDAADDTPRFSTEWTVTSGTLAAGKTVASIQLYADDYPNTVAAGTFNVYFDYVLFYGNNFTLPNVAYGLLMDFPPRESLLRQWNRDTDITAHGGSESALINIGCDLDQGDWKRDGDEIDGEVFLDILHNRTNEPWQWLDTGSHQFKVTVHPKFDLVGRRLDLELREYSLKDKDTESYVERYGIGL